MESFVNKLNTSKGTFKTNHIPFTYERTYHSKNNQEILAKNFIDEILKLIKEHKNYRPLLEVNVNLLPPKKNESEITFVAEITVNHLAALINECIILSTDFDMNQSKSAINKNGDIITRFIEGANFSLTGNEEFVLETKIRQVIQYQSIFEQGRYSFYMLFKSVQKTENGRTIAYRYS